MTDPQNSTQAADDLTEQGALTASDIASLQEYLDKMEELAKREPPMLPPEFWDKFFEDTKGMDEIPPEYQDKVCIQDMIVHSEIVDGKHRYIPEGKTVKGYSDIVWENWNRERAELEKQYHDIIVKALKHAARNPDLFDKAETDAGTILIDVLLKGMAASKIPEQKREVITALQTVIPKYHIIPNTALSNYLTSGDLSKPFDLKVINKKGKQKEITNFTIVSYDPNSTIAKVAENMTEYERGIYNAICSVYKEAMENGQPPIFTTDMLYRAMPGSGDKPSPQEKGAITKAIEKHRFTHIDSDITEELRAKKLIPDDVEEVKLNDFILSVKAVKVRMKNGGQQVTAYMINSTPLLLEYGQLTNNLITVSRKWLDIKQVKNGKPTQFALLMTQERQAMTGYLIRRIKVMQNDKKNKKPTQSDTILFATLFDAIGLKNPSRDKALNTRKSCYAILDYYKAEKIITDYEEQRKGRSVTGVKIIL